MNEFGIPRPIVVQWTSSRRSGSIVHLYRYSSSSSSSTKMTDAFIFIFYFFKYLGSNRLLTVTIRILGPATQHQHSHLFEAAVRQVYNGNLWMRFRCQTPQQQQREMSWWLDAVGKWGVTLGVQVARTEIEASTHTTLVIHERNKPHQGSTHTHTTRHMSLSHRDVPRGPFGIICLAQSKLQSQKEPQHAYKYIESCSAEERKRERKKKYVCGRRGELD